MTYKKKSKGDSESNWRASEKKSVVKYAGTLIFNKELNKILLVQGREAMKWGPPKGEANPNELPIATALRETFEETGLQLEVEDAIKTKYDVPCSFYITNITFYIYVLDESLLIDPQDMTEICGYKWFTIDFLKNLIKNTEYYKSYNSPIRSILDDQARYNVNVLVDILRSQDF